MTVGANALAVLGAIRITFNALVYTLVIAVGSTGKSGLYGSCGLNDSPEDPVVPAPPVERVLGGKSW